MQVLNIFNKAGILKHIILIGSWSIYFYKDYFKSKAYSTFIRTRDIDFLVPHPRNVRANVSVPELLKDLGFVISYIGSKGYMKLEHPDLVVEFLSPERGKGTDRPIPIPRLNINAVALRFLNLLTENTIKVAIESFEISLPHPANFALHKLIIFQRRFKEDKAIKDRNAAVEIFRTLVDKGEAEIIKHIFNFMLPKWQKKVIKGLEEAKENDIAQLYYTSGTTGKTKGVILSGLAQ